MRTYAFQVVNVFAEHTAFDGNPLAVFEDARGLTEAEMLKITDQFNLSETTFIFPSQNGSAAKVRIFSPGYEMRFAGHPTLGTAHVVRALHDAGDAFILELKVGPISVTARGDEWELTAAPSTWREGPSSGLDAMLGISENDVLPGARWVSTGTEQLIIPLRNESAVRAVIPKMESLFSLARNSHGQVNAYVFAPTPTGFISRFFWEQQNAIREDPGTGSACANLGGWWLSHDKTLPMNARIEQGHATGRLNVLSLRVNQSREIFVGGRVRPLMRGTLSLD